MGQANREPACVIEFRSWLERLGTGCRFAGHIASKALVHYDVVEREVTRELTETLDASIEQAGVERRLAIVIFRNMHSPAEIAAALQALHEGGRWIPCWVASEVHQGRRFAMLRLHWKTASGRLTSVIGFAPFRCMPIMRRAPYAAMALWPTEEKVNVEAKDAEEGEPVGITYSIHEFSAEDYKERFRKTREEVKRMSLDDDEDRVLLRDVAFRLPVEDVEVL
jgi:hypothetical protein